MKKIIKIWLLFNFIFGANFTYSDINNYVLENDKYFDIPDTLRLLGLMVEFSIESPDNAKTSGNGKFLSDSVAVYNTFFNSMDSKCKGFLVDKPPHNSLYFDNQLEAVGNYYKNISGGKLDYTTDIILNSNSIYNNGYYNVSNEMQYYAMGDEKLVELFIETIDSAKFDIENYFKNTEFSPEEVVFVVFHAGLGGDFSYPAIDPTIYDLKSAHIDSIMMKNMDAPIINSIPIYSGILLPETQNILYFDVVEDIFGNLDSGVESLCDIQVGMTGIFAMLLGFELGLPAIYNTETGKPGVGYFGLMDYGSNNGRGVIPAKPNPWTSIKAGWLTEINISTQIQLDSILIKSQKLSNEVIRIDIAHDEYFLIENRNNWVLPFVDIDSLRIKNKISDQKLGYWYDSVISEFGNDQLFLNNESEVIVKFDNYDYGLPGSGILIWHIKEPEQSIYSLGINNDLNNSHILIEEADGSRDIGFESYAFFSNDDPTIGTKWDMWYIDNEAYLEFANISLDQVIFNNNSNPNSRTTDGAESFLSIAILSNKSDSMYIDVEINENIEIVDFLNEDLNYLGNIVYSDSAALFFEHQDLIYKYSSEGTIQNLDNLIYLDSNRVYSYLNEFEYINHGGCIHPICDNFDTKIFKLGYLVSEFDSILISDILSLGDIDRDGLDEIVIIESGNILVKNYSTDTGNQTLLDGFPVYGDFFGVPLIANILSIEDNLPEIICRENDNIIILSNKGKRLRTLSSKNIKEPIALIPNWNGNMALLDGSRLLLYDLDLDYSYWLNPNGRASGLPFSSGVHEPKIYSYKKQQNAYNYPNPIVNQQTTFRFYVDGLINKVQIKIYDVAGYLVKDDLKITNLLPNEFNEIIWKNIQLDSGLYLAEIKYSTGRSELIKIVII